jgi:hypothetical protein
VEATRLTIAHIPLTVREAHATARAGGEINERTPLQAPGIPRAILLK